MQITHEEAHRLIQFNADGQLKPQQKNLLILHLEECTTCQQYANSIERMEAVLRPMLGRTLAQQHLPLSIDVILERGKSQTADRVIMATRIAAFAVMSIAFFFSAWNFTISSRQTPTPILQNVPVIPTPFMSTTTAGTEIGFENCAMTSYIVKKKDTLAGIADRFSVPAEQIVQFNSIRNETVITGQALSIPMCHSTPSNPTASHTITFTPALSSTTTTPGG